MRYWASGTKADSLASLFPARATYAIMQRYINLMSKYELNTEKSMHVHHIRTQATP